MEPVNFRPQGTIQQHVQNLPKKMLAGLVAGVAISFFIAPTIAFPAAAIQHQYYGARLERAAETYNWISFKIIEIGLFGGLGLAFASWSNELGKRLFRG